MEDNFNFFHMEGILSLATKEAAFWYVTSTFGKWKATSIFFEIQRQH
jgi:hypothetical protein